MKWVTQTKAFQFFRIFFENMQNFRNYIPDSQMLSDIYEEVFFAKMIHD